MRTTMKTRINFLLITISTLLLISCSDNRDDEIDRINSIKNFMSGQNNGQNSNNQNSFEQPNAKFTSKITRPLTVTLSLPYQSETNLTSVTIDWGDGTTETNYIRYYRYSDISHEYKSIGVYKITLTLGKYDENGYYHTDKHQEVITVEAPSAKYLTKIEISQYNKSNTYMVLRVTDQYNFYPDVYYNYTSPYLLSNANLPAVITLDSPLKLDYNVEKDGWQVEIYYETTKNGTKNKLNTLEIDEADFSKYPKSLIYTCNNGNKYILYFEYK